MSKGRQGYKGKGGGVRWNHTAHSLIYYTDMRIVLLGSRSIWVNLFCSSPNLEIFEANYGPRGNNLASIISKLIKKMALIRLFYDDLCKQLHISSVLQLYLFGSGSVLPVLPTILKSETI